MRGSSVGQALAVLVFFASEGLALSREGARLGRRPYRFDPGGAGSTLETGAILLTASDASTRKRGYGWSNSLLQPYARPELTPSRSPWMIDGYLARHDRASDSSVR